MTIAALMLCCALAGGMCGYALGVALERASWRRLHPQAKP